MKPAKLTKAERKALEEIRAGADIFSPLLARTLRDIERKHPLLLQIVKPQGTDGSGCRPYFGAILTAAGKTALAASSAPSAP